MVSAAWHLVDNGFYAAYLPPGRSPDRQVTCPTGRPVGRWMFWVFLEILEILDTAGTEQFASMRDLYIKNGQGFLLIYSLLNRQTFTDLKPMRDQILRVKNADSVPLILVGNKSDMFDEREVSANEAKLLAEEWGCPHFETSAKSNTNVDEVFTEIVRRMKTTQKSSSSKRGCCVVL